MSSLGAVDFAIISIREDEFEAVLEWVGPENGWKWQYGTKTGLFYSQCTVPGPTPRTVAAVRCLEEGSSDAQNITHDLIRELDPSWVLIVGMASGLAGGKLALGDVAVSSRIHDFRVEAVLRDGERAFDNRGGPIDRAAGTVIANLAALKPALGNWSELGLVRPPPPTEFYGDDKVRKLVCATIEQHADHKQPIVRAVPIASSDRWIEDTELIAIWKQSANMVEVIEMASAGAYHAAFGRKPFVAIRGIAEIIGAERSSAWTVYACQAAASFARALIQAWPFAPAKLPTHTQGNGTASSPQPRDEDEHSTSIQANAQVEPIHVARPRLPDTGEFMVGRRDEIRMLDAAWSNSEQHVISIIAFGGVGKTALVKHWLGTFAGDGYRGAGRVFEWSFYSQGTREQMASSDVFIHEALYFFGDPDPDTGTRFDRSERLIHLITAKPTLLILDGIEPLQYPPGPMEGRLKDPALALLLKGLCFNNPGLCIVTSRIAIKDIAPWQASIAPRIDLTQLSPAAGAELLRNLGVTGTESQRQVASTEFAGHALALTLLGTYLRDIHNGAVEHAREVSLLEEDAEQGGHAWRVMRSYEHWLESESDIGDSTSNLDGKQALSILRLLGLFDRPMRDGEIKALLQPPKIPDLTDHIVDLEWSRWKRLTARLRRARLIDAPMQSDVDAIDTHPLIREYFSARLRSDALEAWRTAHDRIYEYLKQTAVERPETLRSMAPLYDAVTHGCHAARYQDALDEVLRARIGRQGEGYSLKKLGAFGAELSALASFFDRPWDRPVQALDGHDQAWLLNSAGFCLRAIGRLHEALVPMQAGLEADITRNDLENATIAASNLSELQTTLGELVAAENNAQKSIDLARASHNTLWEALSHAAFANVAHQRGHLAVAADAFHTAETMLTKHTSDSLLYSIWGYYYCDFLLTVGRLLTRDESALQPLGIRWHTMAWIKENVMVNPDEGTVFVEALRHRKRVTWQLLEDTQHMEKLLYKAPYHFREVQTRASTTLQRYEKRYPMLSIALDNLSIGRAYTAYAAAHSPAHTALWNQAADYLDRAVMHLRSSGHEEQLPRGLLARADLYCTCLTEQSAPANLRDAMAVETDLTEVERIAERGSMFIFLAESRLGRARLALVKDEPDAAYRHLARASELIEQTGCQRLAPELAFVTSIADIAAG